ncbi:phage tail-collar fiber domain-containing protein [Celerinatantimonas diazotrophica]|uniref:Phage-related tail fiber protein n=1 Tax=Celerinatantimonas diazotrophica TaxID=412034 RepID=A0A4R1K4B3_9GAMM|nr:phage tail protein [Celerinatantimonas diazotrophica]TCK58944.1 phage-related tail fiber protein [Celerinatantimonas diazotrophica]CAG9297578.1 hypothetical protein CEDIAZO_02766 [Celerinatantimonas diazotrophica]
MNEFFTILTTVGAAKLANATALGTTIEITEMAVGDGGGKAVTPNQSQTSLVHTLRRKPLNSITIDPDNPNWVICEQVLPPEIGGWTIREVGLFDTAGDLIAVGNFPETYKPLLSEGSGRTQTIRIVLEVSSASSVELKIDPSVVLATREYVNQQDASVLQQAKDYASQQDTSLKAYVDTQDKAGQTAAKADATKKANQTLDDAKGYADSQDAKMLASAKADASNKANAAESAAKNYAQAQDNSLKTYVDTQDKSYQTAATTDAMKKANQALADAKSYADSQDAKMLASAKTDASSKASAAESSAKNYASQQDNIVQAQALAAAKSYANTQDAATLKSANSHTDGAVNTALSKAKSYADAQDAKVLSSANTDASSKANAAESSAKSYADTKDAAHVRASDPHSQYLNESRFNSVIGSYLSNNPQATVGQIILVPATTAPSGYLKANGASLSRSTYAKLWAYAQASGNLVDEKSKDIGNFGSGDGSSTFTVPDLRGEFLRFLDDGRGVDSSRTIGSYQAQAIQSHYHRVGHSSSNLGSDGIAGGSHDRYYKNTTSTGGTETRPRNIALLACIKY